MSAQDIMNLFGNGFYPIIISGLFFWWFTQDYKKEQEKTRAVMEELKETVNALKQVVEIIGKKNE